MNEKLNYLEMLKNNVGEEMAEMMSDEITKVMDEQRSIEMEYARLVQQRDQLKGITNKHRLEETKGEIMVSLQSAISFMAVTLIQKFSCYRTSLRNLRTVRRSSAVSCKKSQPLSLTSNRCASTRTT